MAWTYYDLDTGTQRYYSGFGCCGRVVRFARNSCLMIEEDRADGRVMLLAAEAKCVNPRDFPRALFYFIRTILSTPRLLGLEPALTLRLLHTYLSSSFAKFGAAYQAVLMVVDVPQMVATTFRTGQSPECIERTKSGSWVRVPSDCGPMVGNAGRIPPSAGRANVVFPASAPIALSSGTVLLATTAACDEALNEDVSTRFGSDLAGMWSVFDRLTSRSSSDEIVAAVLEGLETFTGNRTLQEDANAYCVRI